jgi:putative holliday junction resolvase
MPKVLAIDYGLKRTGIAITDDLMMIASPLETVETGTLLTRLKTLLARENVVCLVVGEALHRDGSESPISKAQQKFVDQLRKNFPHVPVERVDEMYTSKLAAQALVMGGMKKKERMKKENLDRVSAALILQTWLEQRAKAFR